MPRVKIDGHLPEDAAFLQAEAREAQKDYKGAVAIYESLVTRKLARPQTAWLRLGLAADGAGQPARSVEALQRAYYDYPATSEADQAGSELDRQDVDIDAALAPKELARAETLFQARRWTHARASYLKVRPFVAEADRERVAIRIAGAEIALGRHREGRDALRPLLGGPLADEANFHYVAAARGLNLKDEHRALARAFVEKFPNSPFAEEVLNHLASAFIVDDQDDEADAVFREILARYPAGRFAERAAWKAGWTAYRDGRFSEALQYFDQGAAQFPRSDYRPSWLYWAGRAATQAGDLETGIVRLRLAATDYHNSYYGRLAVARLKQTRGGVVPSDAAEGCRPGDDSHRRPHRVAHIGGPQSRSVERAAICATGVGRFAAVAGHHRAGAQTPRQRPRRHQCDEARVSAIPRRRRRDAADRRSCR